MTLRITSDSIRIQRSIRPLAATLAIALLMLPISGELKGMGGSDEEKI